MDLLYKHLVKVLGEKLVDQRIKEWMRTYLNKEKHGIRLRKLKIRYICSHYRIAVFCLMQEEIIKEIRIFILRKDKDIAAIEKILPKATASWTKSEISVTLLEIPHDKLKSLKQYQELVKQGKNPRVMYNGLFLKWENGKYRRS